MAKRFALVLHRWLGVVLCLFFLVWFPSGIGMMYWEFPTVTADDRLARSPSLAPERIGLSPAEAYAALHETAQPGPAEIRLNTFDGRPVYRFRQERDEAIVYADTGERQRDVSKELMLRVAAAWTGQPAHSAAVNAMDDVDQWTVQGAVRNQSPLSKYSWPNGEEVYVSHVSGEVVQYTTSASRLGAYLGPIPHWLYFTPLRKHQPQWSRFVIWTSGIGTIAVLLGLFMAISVVSPSKRYRMAGRETMIPYRGQKRWHAVLGLMFGVGAATWAFSGMLSMDPFPQRASRSGEGDLVSATLRNRVALDAFAAVHPREALARAANLDVRELELVTVAGQSAYVATLSGAERRVLTLDGQTRTEFDRSRVAEAMKAVAGPARLAGLSELTHYDRYYLDRHGKRPLPVWLAHMNDGADTRYYIDPRTARIVGSYSSGSWVSRWLYHGLHSLDFPWLYAHRPAWDIVVITFMLGGTALSLTSLVLAWRVVGRKLAGSGDAPDRM